MGSPNGWKIRVFVVEDHDFFRRGLRRVLENHGMEVVGDATSAEDAIADMARARPDVVLMDLNLPGMSGVDATARITAAPAAPRVVMITVSAANDDLYAALVAGATGYLVKDAEPSEIVAGVREAASGQSRVSGPLVSALVDRVRDLGAGAAATPEDGGLSAREHDVLRRMVRGEDNVAIATGLGISAHTVASHAAAIYTKLRVENRIQATAYAIRSGIA
jgi:DNA-binding NarL/FixJ family response regulator